MNTLTKEEIKFIKENINEKKLIDPELIRYGRDTEYYKKVSNMIKSINKKL